MTKRRKLVMATNNAGKLREARAIAGDRIEILSLEDIGFHDDIEETADTLEGNALIKVRAVKNATGFNCFADDTGLLVDALDGAPGVHTARYAGEECDPDRNIDLLLRNLEGVTDRHARFATSVALSLDGEEHTFEGTVEGSIAEKRSGSHGFGYDPVFVPQETGVCFAEMTDDAKNAISHRGRAISAMMKWLTALCICLFFALNDSVTANAAGRADWRLFNTFDDKVEYIFDTPDKTYFLAQAQLYEPAHTDNNERLLFLFAKDKETGETRPYNSDNILSRSLITSAAYNVEKNYLLIVYDDLTIDLLFDDGSVFPVTALRDYNGVSKAVRSISFDPVLNRVYLATDFGFLVLNDEIFEVAFSGIFNQPIDRMVRVADRFIILHNKVFYEHPVDAKQFNLANFSAVDWGGEGSGEDLLRLTDERCILSRRNGSQASFYIIDFTDHKTEPAVKKITNIDNSFISENKQGLMFSRYRSIFRLDRNDDHIMEIPMRSEEYHQPIGSWDFKEFYFSKSREGFYSLRHEDDDSWAVTSQPARPNSPAAFRSDNLLYSPSHGMMVNTHGINQNFKSDFANNPILLSGFRNQEWTMYGLPYLDPQDALRLINPCGMAQDPDDPDVFYFGSLYNGLLRYNIKDLSSLLHMTKSDDAPNKSGHVSLQNPYSSWSNSFMLTNPKFDSRGNLLIGHLNTETEGSYYPEIWIWSAEDRRASTSPETFRPFTRYSVSGLKHACNNIVVPMTYSGNQNIVALFPVRSYSSPFAVYDHNGTVKETSDDRQVVMKDLEDSDGNLSFIYYFCAIEDPATGLVWVGTDNGVFTFDPKESFSNPGKVSRIKVSRNDGTSLADYLLSGTSVNNIAIDGQGRKWFSLSGGGLVCTSADGKTILQEISTENSMLPSDIVYASCYNPDNNSMMIATSAGLCEYYLAGQSNAESVSDVRAFPNPVRHDYYGWVTIDGLEDDCIVKIADSAGNIVRELGPAVTGKVLWDVCGMDLNRVPSGVYFVLVSSGPTGGSCSEATKILVINR